MMAVVSMVELMQSLESKLFCPKGSAWHFLQTNMDDKQQRFTMICSYKKWPKPEGPFRNEDSFYPISQQHTQTAYHAHRDTLYQYISIHRTVLVVEHPTLGTTSFRTMSCWRWYYFQQNQFSVAHAITSPAWLSGQGLGPRHNCVALKLLEHFGADLFNRSYCFCTKEIYLATGWYYAAPLKWPKHVLQSVAVDQPDIHDTIHLETIHFEPYPYLQNIHRQAWALSIDHVRKVIDLGLTWVLPQRYRRKYIDYVNTQKGM